MTLDEQEALTRFLAAKVKEYFPDWLALQAIRERYRDVGNDGLEILINDLRRSSQYQQKVAALVEAIDERVPSSGEASLDQELVKLIQSCGLNSKTIH
jgi:hypothetical protein